MTVKVFKVTADNATYDEYISVVIVAESKERAFDIVTNESQPYNSMRNRTEQYDVTFIFEEHQMPLYIEEISLEKEIIVTSEYHGG